MKTAPILARTSKAAVQAALWLCALNLLTAVLAAQTQCTNPTQVPNGIYTSGDHSRVDNNALSTSIFEVSVSASATFVAGNCIHLAPGFHANAIGATVPTTFHAWVDTAPTAVSFSPSNQTGLSQSFTWTVSSPSGQSHLSHVFALFNTTSNSTLNACYIHYDASSNLVYLADNASANWLGGFVPSSTGSVNNSQCTISGTGSSPNPTSSGMQLSLTLTVTFQTSFAGTKNEYLFALDGEGVYSGWQPMGTWTVPAPQYTLTTAVNPPGGGNLTLSPPGGVYTSGTQVAVTATPGSGYSFTGWTGVDSSNGTVGYVTMYTNRSVTANFTTAGTQHVITSNPVGLSVTVDGVACTTSYTNPCTRYWSPWSSHTVVADFRQQLAGTPYFFSYLGGTGVRQNEEVWSDGTLTIPVTAQSSQTTIVANFLPNAVETLKTCLSSSASSTCVLAEGSHPVTSTIVVGRSNVTIRGEISDRTRTRLLRETTYVGEMMKVDVPPPAMSVTIRDLTFCGGSLLSAPPPTSGCLPPPVQTTCSALQQARIGVCSDLQIVRADTEERLSNPWETPGSYSVTISNSAFEGSAGHAVAIYPTAPQKVNDVYITGTVINRSEVTGLLVGVLGEDYRDHRACDDNASFRDDSEGSIVHAPRNIRVEGNEFRENLTGALGVNSARWFALRNNNFVGNYYSPQAGNVDGGTVFFDKCTDMVQIRNNELHGPSYVSTGGLELWGRNLDVGGDSNAQKNTISGYKREGIGLNSVLKANIRNNETSNNGSVSQTGGILVWTRASEGPCEAAFRETEEVTLSSNNSTAEPYGVVLADGEISTNVMNKRMWIETSGAVTRDAYVTLTGTAAEIFGVPLPAAPTFNQSLPRALPVIPVEDLSAPIRAVPAKCPDPYTPGDNRREVFTFPASDVLGADNIYSHEVVFSVVSDGNPGEKTGAQGCLFIFYPPDDLSECRNPDGSPNGCGSLWLANDDGVYDWTDSSAVGSGGTDLANSYCKIRAGSVKTKVVSQGKVLKLNLDVELLNSTTKYMYTKTENRQHAYSNGGAWRYWGFW